MNLERFNKIDYSTANLELESAVLDLLIQCSDASDADLSAANGYIDTIFDIQWDRWQTFSPEGIDSVDQFISRNWSTSNFIRFKLCCDLIFFNYLYIWLDLLSEALNSDEASIRSLADQTIAGLTSYTVRAESVFSRINTIIRLSSGHISDRHTDDLLKLRNSVHLNQNNPENFIPISEIFDAMQNFLNDYWKSKEAETWLHELKMDYLILKCGN